MPPASSLHLAPKRSLAMTAQLQQAIGFLQLTNRELRERLEREAAANPFLQLRSVEPPRSRGKPSDARVQSAVWRGGENAEDLFTAPSASLAEHVSRQIGLAFSGPDRKRIAFAFLEALEPYGWLGAEVAEVAEACGCSVAEAEAVLARMQQFEPAGLFARSLAECLRLQAADDGALSDSLARLLDNLHLLADGGPEALAEACGGDLSRVQADLGLLRKYDPKPGNAFLDAGTVIRPPDVLLRETADGFAVELNGSTLPELVVRDAPADGSTGDPDEIASLAFACSLKRAVDQRNANTLAVAAEVVRRQSAFLRDCHARPVPLTLQEVAEAIGVHASTVSRVVNGLTLEAPRGLVEFRQCFTRGLPLAAGDEAISTESVCQKIREMIHREPAARPLSDAAICLALQAEGVMIERRTVAKYRIGMAIPCSSARRRGR